MNSLNILLVFVKNGITKTFEFVTGDKRFQVSRNHNPADTGTSSNAADASRDSIWVKVPHFLKPTKCPLKTELAVTRPLVVWKNIFYDQRWNGTRFKFPFEHNSNEPVFISQT